LSENIIVLGRGVQHPSRTYKRICYCVAGVGEKSGWLRLYPITANVKLEPFDIIQVVIKEEHPESLRPETRKIYIDPPPKVVGHVSQLNKRIEILQKNLDSGTFLHDESWRGIKTLGLIQPKYPEFEVRNNRVSVKYKCNAEKCAGHINEVMDWSIIDTKSRRGSINNPKDLEDKFVNLEREILLERKKLWFVVGTHRLHPSRWILIEFLITDNI
jgi:hypothetical protein